MKILFDQGVPVPLRKHLEPEFVKTAYELGWSKFENGALLNEAELAGFDVFVTTDKNLKYQQNVPSRVISIVVLPTTNWPVLKQYTTLINQKVVETTAGSFVEIEL